MFVFKFLLNKTCLIPDIFMESGVLGYDNGTKVLHPLFHLIYPALEGTIIIFIL